MTRLKYSGLFLAVLAFLMLSAPQNHCEAEDTYYYARMVEQGAWGEMFHQHHLLYLPIARAVYQTAQQFGFTGRALPVLIGMSMVSAAGVILFFAALLRRSGQSRLWVFPLLFSYGFWRYACAAEIYLPALAAVSGAWFFALRPKGMPWAICCSGLALLLHVVCLPAVFAAGLLFVFQKQWKRAGLYFICVGVAVAGVYGLILNSVGAGVFQDEQVLRGSLFEASTWLKGMFAFGQNVLSGNFLFSIPLVAEKLAVLFPYHMLQEEFFMGRQAGALWACGSTVTFVGALLLLVVAVRKCFRLSSLFDWALAVWLGGNMAMALLFEPANSEMWIFTLLPFWFLVSNGWKRASSFVKVSADKELAPNFISRHWKFLLPVLATAMLLHNVIGGMAFVKSKKGDYCRQKASNVAGLAHEGDLILTADSYAFITFLQYQTAARVMDAKFVSSKQWPALRDQTTGRIFIFDDVVNLLPPVARRSEESVCQMRTFAALLKPKLHSVSENEFGVLYQWF